MAERSTSALRGLIGDIKAASSPFRNYLVQVYETHRKNTDGTVANYIPELAKADPNWFGIAVCTVDGKVYEVGDTNQRFTIQSASKPFVFGVALQDLGRDPVLQKIGVEPTGDAFNSMIKLDGANRPHNPMINAGAIAAADLIKGADPTDKFNRLLRTFSDLAGRELDVDMAVFTSERTTGHRNRSIAHLMLNFGMIENRVEETLDLYFKQCSILTTAKDLAVMGATLANAGVNPLTGKACISPEYIQDLLSIMLTCGMYDYAGEWAYRVGLPAKSGVGGGIVAVVPGKLGIGFFSPPLDAKGNSVRGIKAATQMSTELNLHALSCSKADKLDHLLRTQRPSQATPTAS